MLPETLREAFNHALSEYPRESCGLVLVVHGKERYFPCRNADDSGEHFSIAPESALAASQIGEKVEVVHSHPDASVKPSQADLVGCEASKLPWTILGVPSGAVHRFEPSGYRAPLVGRVYSFGVLDCWTLVRDWFSEVRGVKLPDFDSGSPGWWLRGENKYADNFREAGFGEIREEDLQHGDVILMAYRSPVPNHSAVYLGNQQMIHHLTNRLSCREIYGGVYRKMTTHYLRHRP